MQYGTFADTNTNTVNLGSLCGGDQCVMIYEINHCQYENYEDILMLTVILLYTIKALYIIKHTCQCFMYF